MITYRPINKKKSLKMKYIVTKYQNDGNSVQAVLHYDLCQLNFAAEKGNIFSGLRLTFSNWNKTLKSFPA